MIDIVGEGTLTQNKCLSIDLGFGIIVERILLLKVTHSVKRTCYVIHDETRYSTLTLL